MDHYRFILEALQYSVGKTQQDVDLAEKYLNQAKYCDGYLPTLLLIACDTNITNYVRQAAVIHLKATIEKRWKNKETPISDLDKQTLKDSILDGTIKCAEHPKLYRQMVLVIRKMAEDDFPNQWQKIFTDIISNFSNSGDYFTIFGNLLALKALVENHEFLQGKDREPLEHIAQQTFPFLENLLKAAILNTNDQAADNIIHIILKIVDPAVNNLLPQYFMNEKTLQTWLALLQGVIEKPLPMEAKSYTTDRRVLDLRERSTLWLSKKWCIKILNRLLEKADKDKIKDENKSFPDFFLPKYAGHYLEGIINFLLGLKGYYIHPKVHYHALRYMVLSFRYPQQLYPILISQLEPILYDIIMPALQLTPQEEEDWALNPLEFIRREDRVWMSDNSNSLLKAREFLFYLCSKKFFKSTDGELILTRFFEFAGHVLLNSTDLRTNSPADFKLKEVVLHILVLMHPIILVHEQFAPKMAYLIESFLINEYRNTQGPLKCRLCSLFGVYGGLKFEKMESLMSLCDALYGSLCSDDLPIMVQAGIALDELFYTEEAQVHIRPHLDKILLSYVTLIDKIDNEDLAKALKGVISKFLDHIYPFAVDLVKYLVGAFHKAEQDSIQAATLYETQEKEALACGYLSTVKRILEPALPKEVIEELEKILLPVLAYILKGKNSENIDLSLRILNLLLFQSPVLSEEMWTFFPVLNYLVVGLPEEQESEIANQNVPKEFKGLEAIKFNGKGEEFVVYIVPCLQKYIKKDKGILLEARDFHYNLTYLELMCQTIEKVYEICYDCQNDIDMVRVTTLFLVLVEDYQPLTDELMTFLLEKVKINMPQAKSFVMQRLLIQIVAACLWRNASLTLQYLQYNDILQYIFEIWVNLFPEFQHIFEFKRVLIGLSSLLRVSLTQLPPILLESMKGFLNQMTHLTFIIMEMNHNNLTDYKLSNTEAFRRKAVENKDSNDDDDEDSEGDYHEELDDYKTSDLWEPKEEHLSVLLDTNEIIYFKESLEILKTNQENVFMELMSLMSQQDLLKLQSVFEAVVAGEQRS